MQSGYMSESSYSHGRPSTTLGMIYSGAIVEEAIEVDADTIHFFSEEPMNDVRINLK